MRDTASLYLHISPYISRISLYLPISPGQVHCATRRAAAAARLRSLTLTLTLTLALALALALALTSPWP